MKLTSGQRPRLFVQFLCWFENTHSIYIAIEYIPHGDLDQYLQQHRSKAAAEAQEITYQILQGLAVVHERDICHRDLKPKVKENPQIKETGHAHSIVEHSHSVTLAYMGKDYGFWNLETDTGYIFKGWHNLLPGPGGAWITP